MTTENMRIVFVYDDLQRGGTAAGDTMKQAGAEYLSRGSILDRDMILRDNNETYPILHRVAPKSGTYIQGELWVVPVSGLPTIDVYQGAPGFVEREDVTVWVDWDGEGNPESVKALTYVLPYEENKVWLNSLPVIESGYWRPNGAAEECNLCEYWLDPAGFCSNCNGDSDEMNQWYYNDGVVDSGYDEVKRKSGHEAGKVMNEWDGFEAVQSIFVTKSNGEAYGPYDDICSAADDMPVIASLEPNRHTYIIGVIISRVDNKLEALDGVWILPTSTIYGPYKKLQTACSQLNTFQAYQESDEYLVGMKVRKVLKKVKQTV